MIAILDAVMGRVAVESADTPANVGSRLEILCAFPIMGMCFCDLDEAGEDWRGMMGKTNAQIDKQHDAISYALKWYTEALRQKFEADARLERAASALDQTLAQVVLGKPTTPNECFKRFTP